MILHIVCLSGFLLCFKNMYAQTCYDYESEVRVLVAYTDDVANDYPNSSILETLIQPSIDNINQAYINSGINHSVRLVRAIEIDYNETNSLLQSRDDFKNGNYGFNIIDDLRYFYHADICVLITKNGDIGGVAAGIGVTRDHAYCVIKSAGMVSRYAMAHEIGHLYGGLHETVLDSSNIPYAYGHGYVFPDLNDAQGKKVHTIMAYGTHQNVELTNPIPYFSNPNKTYQGKVLGTTSTEDVARVINERYPNIKGSILSEIVTIDYEDSIKDNEVADINSHIEIKTTPGTNYTLESGSETTFRIYSGTGSIKFRSGFHAKAGSHMKAYVYDCSSSNKSYEDTIDNETVVIEKDHKEVLSQYIAPLKIYPNPTKDKLYLEGANNMVSWKLINLLGTVHHGALISDDFKKVEIDMGYLSKGVYFLQIFFKNGEEIIKKVLKD